MAPKRYRHTAAVLKRQGDMGGFNRSNHLTRAKAPREIQKAGNKRTGSRRKTGEAHIRKSVAISHKTAAARQAKTAPLAIKKSGITTLYTLYAVHENRLPTPHEFLRAGRC